MSCDNEASNASAGSRGDVPIDSDSITDPLADGFVDQSQQERGGGGLNLAVETEILGCWH